MAGDLAGKTALVTGCGRFRGMGRSIALALATAGADVAVSDVEIGGKRNEIEAPDPTEANWEGLTSLVAEIEGLGRKAVGLVGDVGRSADAQRMVDEATAALGGVDILVNNAGAPHGPDRNFTWLVPEEAFDEVIRINTKGAFLMSGAVVRGLLDRETSYGRIVNIASGAGRRGLFQRAAYSTSKFGLIGLTQTMATELGPYGITVNCVCPGMVDTPRQASRTAVTASGKTGAPPPVQTPVSRIGLPDDIARAVLFFVDPAADFVTGQSMNVDGGLFMN